jgi:hypothetical protein
MRIMAIGARHQALVYAVVLGFREFRLYISMTAVAQGRLGGNQQILAHFGSVNRVTSSASDAVRHVGRSHEVFVACAFLVTGQTPFGRLLCA